MMRRSVLLLALLSAALAPASALASTLRIDDLPSSVKISWTGFDGDFSVQGFGITGGDGSDGYTIVNGGMTGQINFSGSWIADVGHPQNSYVVSFDESDGSQARLLLTLSESCDIGGCTSFISSAAAGSSFWSERNTLGLPGGPGAFAFTLPDGGSQNVDSYFGTPAGLDITVGSSVSAAPPAVPEPATLTLVATGLALGFRRRASSRRPPEERA
jgi:hypothetical protein